MARLQRLTMLFHKNITCSYPELHCCTIPVTYYIVQPILYCCSLQSICLNITSLSFPATAAKLLDSPNKLRSSSSGPEDKQATLLIICANNINYLITKPSAEGTVNSIIFFK